MEYYPEEEQSVEVVPMSVRLLVFATIHNCRGGKHINTSKIIPLITTQTQIEQCWYLLLFK